MCLDAGQGWGGGGGGEICVLSISDGSYFHFHSNIILKATVSVVTQLADADLL